jgi:hypothetical protein
MWRRISRAGQSRLWQVCNSVELRNPTGWAHKMDGVPSFVLDGVSQSSG